MYALIEGITRGILDDDLYLIDPSTGKPTTWGFWNPKLVNEDPSHYSERGTNSLGILAYLVSAYSITADEKYSKMFWNLGLNYDYIYNVNNAKVDNPAEDNHSDNELLFQTYHILFYSLRRLQNNPSLQSQEIEREVTAMVEVLKPSIERLWCIVQGEKNPLWLGIYAGAAGMKVLEEDISDAAWTLRRWSIDMIAWPVDNSLRWDVTLSPFYGRDSTDPLMRQILPPSERSTQKWNSDPFKYGGGSGYSEEYPGIFNMPYFIMRYYGLITDSSDQ